MKKTLFVLLGVLLLATTVGAGLTFGLEGITTVALLTLLFASADLLILGGLRESFNLGSSRLMWYHLIGSGILLIGLLFALFSAREATTLGLLSAGVLLRAVMAAVLLFIGADFIRGGKHYDVSALN